MSGKPDSFVIQDNDACSGAQSTASMSLMTRGTANPWLRSAASLAVAVVLAVAVSLFSSSNAYASSEVKVFDSTNTSQNSQTTNNASNGQWWAYKFTAFEATTVTRIDIFVTSAAGFEDFFVNIATDFDSDSLGEFNPTETEQDLKCAGEDCARVTFNGSVALSGGNDYWLWIGSSDGVFAATELFDGGASATTGGLDLGYTFASNDIKVSNGNITLDSETAGYPWVRMFATSGGGASGASPGSADKSVRISLTDPEGSECGAGSVSGLAGTWVQLPAPSDCLPADGSTESNLLGWATNADFSVDIAQRQVDNGWGAYETFNDDGQLTGVFIPAGGYTLVSNDTNLYPIFSN